MNLKTGIAVIDIEIKSLKLLKKNLSKNFHKAVELLYNTKGKIIVSGIGKSGHIASKISYIIINRIAIFFYSSI